MQIHKKFASESRVVEESVIDTIRSYLLFYILAFY